MPWHELKALQREENKNPKRNRHQRKLLGRLSHDLDYLETLLTEVKINGPEDEEIPPQTGDKVSKKTEEAISFLRERQEFWSQFKPMYCK